MGIATLAPCQLSLGANYSASNAAPGSQYQPTTAQGTPQTVAKYTVGTGAGQVDEVYSKIVTITASGNTTLNLNSLTDVLGTTLNFTRVKGWLIQLLSPLDDPTNGTLCSSVTVGNASTPFPFNLSVGTTTFTLNGGTATQNGDVMAFATKTAAGITTSGQNNVKIVNNDSVNSAAVQVTFFGGDA